MAEKQTTVGIVLRVFCALMLAVALMGGVGGCRYSEALANIVTDDTAELEPDASPEYREVPSAPENSELTSSSQSESDNLAVQESTLPVYDENAPENGYAKKRVYSEQSDNELPPSEGEDPNPGFEEEPAVAPSEEVQQVEAQGTGEAQEGQGTGEAQEASDTQEGQRDSSEPTTPTGRGGEGKTYGEDGVYEELPDAGSIAATGQYALIVQMLGGAGSLAAADSVWLSEITQSAAFPGEGLEEVPSVWSGDGTQAGSLDVDALIATEADTVLVNDGVDLSVEAQAALESAGFNVVYVPILGRSDTTDADIQMAVQVVGQMLGTSKSKGAADASARTAKWQSMHDTAIKTCSSANGGYSYKYLAGKPYQDVYQPGLTGNASEVRITTAFIAGWEPTSVPTIEADRAWGLTSMYLDGEMMDVSDGVGVSSTVTKGSYALIDYYLQAAGVVNNAYDNARPISANSGGQTLPYAVVPGSSKDLLSIQAGSREYPSALWFGMFGTTSSDTWYTLGDVDFPGIVVADSSIGTSVVTSANKVNGLYNTGQPYDVWVCPSGLAGSWADGTVESFLLTYWAYGVFQENGDTGEVERLLAEFCQEFYGVSDWASVVSDVHSQTRTICPIG